MAITERCQHGVFTFVNPDTSIDPWSRSYFAGPVPRETQRYSLKILNLRDEANLFTPESPFSVPTHGFTVIKHASAIGSANEFKNSTNVEDIYLPEVKDLLKKVTGASNVHIIGCALRLQASGKPIISKSIVQPNATIAKPEPPAIDPTKVVIGGLEEHMRVGPARGAHNDYTPAGVVKMMRCSRADIAESPDVEKVLDALDKAEAESTPYTGPRYASYSVWRPLATVKCDPLAICDPHSIDPERDLVEHSNKQPGYRGDFVAGLQMLSGTHAESQKWYYLENQQPDEPYVIQFFDSESIGKPGRVVGAPHASPEGVGSFDADRRESIEVRCIATW